MADPQILGDTFDTNLYKDIAIYDSDQFLKKSFSRANAFVQPDVICFMGDLMDEGSIATDIAYDNYLKRFTHIFKTHSKVQRIHIPGDNDIGGENHDHVSAFKLKRFRESFNESTIILVQNQFRFIHTNLITRRYPESNVTNKSTSSTNRMVNIILSHISVLSYPGLTMKMVI